MSGVLPQLMVSERDLGVSETPAWGSEVDRETHTPLEWSLDVGNPPGMSLGGLNGIIEP